jgi:predicted transcriptional regulator
MKGERITVRLSAELRRRLKDAAQRDGTRESEIVRKAIARQFAQEGAQITAYERAEKARLIGPIRDLSPDLSTNPKYFDGFGGS